MKKVFTLILLVLIFFQANAGKLTALFSYCTFNIPGDKPYAELYLHVIGTTVKFVPESTDKMKGQIEVQWIIKNGDQIVHFDKYNLNSPHINAADSFIPDFIDQQRIKLNAGTYKLELSIKDNNDTLSPVSLKQDISILFPVDSISISDIQLLENFTKSKETGKFTRSGYDLVPSVNNFITKKQKTLKFYSEIYNSDKMPAEDYLIRYYLSNSNNQIIPNFTFNQKQKPGKINVLLGDIPIVDLPTGDYALNIEVRTKKNEMIASKQVKFQRSNPISAEEFQNKLADLDVTNTFIWQIVDADSLAILIDCLYPIVNLSELDVSEYLIKERDVPSMQRFIYFFWQKRDAVNPEIPFTAYMKEVEKVNASYSATGIAGYATDRGRVYLQYGPPNIVTEEKWEPNTYPYEIWQYYKLNDQSNRKFVFYNPALSTNNYELLHSDARGEVQEPQWQAILHDAPKGVMKIDQTKKKDSHYGSHSDENFNNPR